MTSHNRFPPTPFKRQTAWRRSNRYSRVWLSVPIIILFSFSTVNIAMDNTDTAPRKGQRQPRPTIIVYSDGSAEHLRELKHFTELLAPEDRPEILSGEELGNELPTSVINSATLAYFGRSSRDQESWQKLPKPLRDMISQMRDYEGITPEELDLPYPTTGIWCYGDVRKTSEQILTVFASFDPRDKPVMCRGSSYPELLGFRYDYCSNHLETCKRLINRKENSNE